MKNNTLNTVLALICIAVFAGVIMYFPAKKTINNEQNVISEKNSSTITDTDTLQRNFSYNGVPIHPTCVDALSQAGYLDDDNEISLQECAKDPKGDALIDPESHIYSYTYPPEENGGGSGAYADYKIIAEREGTFYIFLQSSGGGSGQFTNILSARIEGDNLVRVSNDILGGDRANGGISMLEGNITDSFQYSVELTPYDINLLTDPYTELEAYKDLEASASSYFGLGIYRFDMATEKSTLLQIEFDYFDDEHPLVDEKGWTDQYTYQSCFNYAINEYIKVYGTVMEPEDFPYFQELFNCD